MGKVKTTPMFTKTKALFIKTKALFVKSMTLLGVIIRELSRCDPWRH